MKGKHDSFKKRTENEELTVTDNENPTSQYTPGDSVDKFLDIKSANHYLAEKEIGQQNENN